VLIFKAKSWIFKAFIKFLENPSNPSNLIDLLLHCTYRCSSKCGDKKVIKSK
jgi:hypothetical protein